jgi:Holliday junction resolvase-like predicted endonuclease
VALELNTRQARLIARVRTRWPEADVRAHQRAWGVIVEVRRGDRTVSLTAFDGEGGVHEDVGVAFAA